jgi:hypothetical protein
MQERARRAEDPIDRPKTLKSLSPRFHPLLWRIKTLGVRSDFENNPDCFAELVDFLQRILDAGKATVY